MARATEELAPTNFPGTCSRPRYPGVAIRLTGVDGNAFAIIGACYKAALRAEVSSAEIKAFSAEAMSGDYDHLLQTCMRWFDVS